MRVFIAALLGGFIGSFLLKGGNAARLLELLERIRP